MTLLAALVLGGQTPDPPILRSLLVGAGRFADPGIRAPRGVPGDLERMTSVCRAYGERSPAVLSGAASKRAAVQAALDRNAASCKAGDVCLFYYSGLGSTAKDGFASLLPYDAAAGSGGGDLPLAAVARWAKAVAARGGRPLAIVDACWPSKADFAALTKEWHPYDPTPRLHKRGRPIAGLGYDAPGTLLAASDGTGHAYDWQTTETDWYGAFTDLVGQAVVAAGLRGQALSPGGIADVVARAAKEQADFKYMADFRPTIVGRDANAAILGRPPLLSTAGVAGELLAAERERAERYRVALEVEVDDAWTPPARNALYQRAKARLRDALKAAGIGDDVALTTGSQRPDAVIAVRPNKEDGAVYVLPDDEMRARIVPKEYDESSLGEMLPWLERQALLTRLFRLAESGQPTLDGTIRHTLPATVTTADLLSGEVTPPVDAVVLTMDRGEKLGVVHLYSPRARAVDASGSATRPVVVADPALSFRGSALGLHEWRALILEKSPGLSLPSLPQDGVDPSVQGPEFAKARVAFDRGTIPYLRAALKAIRSGEARWTRLVVPYTVENS